ncbi:hypothetical protein NQ176_g8890 [Zarea fungicola]|uniref:Uncharacterized protein n=1 Tax=Zarea fungicola TaxID=93591 RepID=A0ACC1MPX3_9HYPO|nr:hypothetical protein NQ176_g8890 [Lecanicillium fungicola]
MPPKKVTRAPQENISLGPSVRDGELVFGVARIFASFNDTFVHITDLRFVSSLAWRIAKKVSKVLYIPVANAGFTHTVVAKPSPVSPVA